MYKIIHINNKKEIVFSLPSGQILENKSIIVRLAGGINVEISDDDILKADCFSKKYHMINLILIINHDGLSFLPEQHFINI